VRTYTTRRQSIVNALVEKLQTINGEGDFLTNLANNVKPRYYFLEDIKEFPAVHLSAGSETREYQAGGYADRFLIITIRCYVDEENAILALDKLLEDVETVLEENSTLIYTDKRGVIHHTHQTTVLSIDTDEGVLEPLGIGEIMIQVHY
jgi:hypothetical protein